MKIYKVIYLLIQFTPVIYKAYKINNDLKLITSIFFLLLNVILTSHFIPRWLGILDNYIYLRLLFRQTLL